MTKVTCKVDNRWYWALETASITFTSPTGGYVRINKAKMSELDYTQRELVWELFDRSRDSETVELTIDEMNRLVEIGRIAGTVYTKK
jgi:hypothetical protein